MSTAWWSWSSKTTCFSSTGSRSSLTRRPRSREGYQESENFYLIQNLNSVVITQFYIVMINIFPTPSESKVIMIHWKLDTERLWVREAHGVLSGVLVGGLTISGGEHINRILINLSWRGLLGGYYNERIIIFRDAGVGSGSTDSLSKPCSVNQSRRHTGI